MASELNLETIAKRAFEDEQKVVKELLDKSSVFQERKDAIFNRARSYVEQIRDDNDSLSVESFLKQYSLNTYEGVAIMCLAEALLRIPDSESADELIRDKLEKGDWKKHFSKDAGLLLNSSTYGLMLSGKILSLSKNNDELKSALSRIAGRIGEPVIRESLKKSMQILGQKFVIGTDIHKALDKAKKVSKKGYIFSFDMLGEGARTAKQAEKFYNSYINGINEISEFYKKDTAKLFQRQNISVKLSALHPRYELAHKDRVMDELLPRLKEIAAAAMKGNIWMAIDAEETYRLELSLMVFEELLKDKQFEGYNGLGFVVQAYGKRALYVINHLKALAKKYNKVIPVRLVKGAYWDSEIKSAQMSGIENYPVFTRKSHTDLSYLVCAKEMLDNLDCFYPQFATHNALTVASILEISDRVKDKTKFEFQRLFGMGDAFYDHMVNEVPVRIYAPVGTYEELLPYLIRRILENGSNNSFVSLVVDEDEPIGELLVSPVDKIIKKAYTSKKLPLPSEIYLPERENSFGYELGNLYHKNLVESYLTKDFSRDIKARSIIDGREIDATEESCDKAIDVAYNYFPKWNSEHINDRAELLENYADILWDDRAEILNILVYEGKKKPKDAIAELREAIDFLRYYAVEARKVNTGERLPGYTGERSVMNHKGKGVFLCISPWNFPLAIFLGQVSAALVTGNCVIAKPSEQTVKIAYKAIQLAHQAGIPKQALQLMIGKGSVYGRRLTENNKVAGVAFTGSTETAWAINKSLAGRRSQIATLIAETGGQNVMLVDSTALLEKAVDDVVESAFGSTGQRCSACRVVYIQEEVADEFIEVLKGAVEELKVGLPQLTASDVPPVIDERSQTGLNEHINEMKKKAKFISAAKIPNEKETYVAPTAFEISSIKVLEKENFGPILHVIRFKRENIDDVIKEINDTGFALTFGIQSRIYDFINYVCTNVNAGNIYINRSIIGAVVGTHPFGGNNLSGTGPKAGGPNYLQRFLNEVVVTDNVAAIGGNLELIT